MKKWLLLVILVFLLSFSAYAQSIPASDFKVTLIDAITDYLTSQTPKLEKNELKDLIVVYLTTPGDTVDLSGTGKYSGEKLIDIYNKAKGATCVPDCTGKCGGASNGCGGTCNNPCTGAYSAQVASAVKLNQPTVGNPYAYGYYSGPGGGSGSYTIPLGATVWFLVDPIGFTGKSVSDIAIQFTDFAQGGNLEVWIYTIDSSDNLHSGLVFNPVRIPLSTNTYGPWSPRGGHDDSKRYLIKVGERGFNAVPYNIYWWF